MTKTKSEKKREIKFRAWYKNNKEFRYCELTKGEITVIGIRQLPKEDSLEDWQQFTGLKDKNGKEIYEGDVIGYEANDNKQHQGIIEFLWGGFYMRIESGSYTNPADEDSGEIIGNIYQNPELIKNIKDYEKRNKIQSNT